MKKENINYYKSYTDDFVKSKNQNYKLSNDYKWIHNNLFYRICSKILYYIALIFGFFYCKLFLHVKVKNKSILKKYKKTGYFMYGNHTQPIGDVFIPAMVNFPKRIYTIADESNLGVSCIGPLLPLLGILPISDTMESTKKLYKAVSQRVNEKNCIIIYPEAHVWPYYTKIRPFSSTSFKFPVDKSVPTFCMTTTYYKRKYSKKPGIVVYVDGPFLPDKNLNKKDQKEKLCNEVYDCMQDRSTNSTYEYIKYRGAIGK